MADVTILFSGYDSITQGYNEGGYDQDVAFTGLASALGSVTATGHTGVNVTGVAASATAGNTTETAGGGISIGVTGVLGTSSINNVLVWGIVPTDQTPNWAAINPSQTPEWATINASQTPDWTDIAA